MSKRREPMIMNYSRLETDDEFRERLKPKRMGSQYYSGVELDNWAWANLQRRVVWAVPA